MKYKMKTIIAATDFSDAAVYAANYAADMAMAINADLLLLHIAPLPQSFGGMLMVNTPTGIIRESEENIKLQADELLKKITPGKLDIFAEVKMGTFSTALNAVCDKVSPYAVVMGSQGTKATERFFFGSHTVHTMRHLAWPVITVPPGVNFTAIKKIAFACDFNKTDSVPVEEIKILAKEFNAELHIINIGNEHGHHPIVDLKAGWLKVGLGPLKPIYHFIDNVNTDVAIMDFADTNKIDLLIVLPKRLGLLDRFLYKSTSKHLVLHCHVPVMALHL